MWVADRWAGVLRRVKGTSEKVAELPSTSWWWAMTQSA